MSSTKNVLLPPRLVAQTTDVQMDHGRSTSQSPPPDLLDLTGSSSQSATSPLPVSPRSPDSKNGIIHGRPPQSPKSAPPPYAGKMSEEARQALRNRLQSAARAWVDEKVYRAVRTAEAEIAAPVVEDTCRPQETFTAYLRSYEPMHPLLETELMHHVDEKHRHTEEAYEEVMATVAASTSYFGEQAATASGRLPRLQPGSPATLDVTDALTFEGQALRASEKIQGHKLEPILAKVLVDFAWVSPRALSALRQLAAHPRQNAVRQLAAWGDLDPVVTQIDHTLLSVLERSALANVLEFYHEPSMVEWRNTGDFKPSIALVDKLPGIEWSVDYCIRMLPKWQPSKANGSS